MKPINLTVLFLALIFCVAAAPKDGCQILGVADKAVFDEVPVAVEQQVPHVIVRTQVVERVVMATNEASEVFLATNFVEIPLIQTQYVTTTLWQTNLVVRESVKSGLETVGNLIPIPGGDTATAVIGLILAGVASWRNRRNKSRAEQVKGVLVDNIGQARAILREAGDTGAKLDQKFVDAMKDLQSLAGVRAEIHDTVNKKKADPNSPVE